MKPLIFLLISIFFLFSPTGLAQEFDGSQILAVRKAKLIVVAEVVYLAKPLPVLTTASHTNSQVIVFKITEILRGKYTEKFIKVKMEFGVYGPSLSNFTFRKGNQLILVLIEQVDSQNCFEQEITPDFKIKTNPNPAFNEYAKVPCYISQPHVVIQANTEEIEAMKWLVNLSTNGNQ